jgi:hypothetical protein
MMAGLPDIIGCYQGRFFAIETKLDTKVTVRQAYVHGLIRRAGGTVVVAHSVRAALSALVPDVAASTQPESPQNH